jgi:hypothetical protein
MSNAEQPVLDAIDVLVNEQLADGETETGLDDDPAYPVCRWCDWHWHGLKRGSCPGMLTEGPVPAPEVVDGPTEPLLEQAALIARMFDVPLSALGITRRAT